jgi:inhibitor of KinA sporulation pathway (predicted exonuclease)
MLLPKSFIIFDTEYTSWEGSQEREWSLPNEYMELVQIAGYKVQKKNNNYEIIDSINIYIIPKINNKLSKYFIKLTNITNEHLLKNGISFEEGINKFRKFISNLNCYSYGNDFEVFEYNFKLYNIKNVFLNDNNFYDIKSFFDKYGINTKKYSSGSVYKSVGLTIKNINIHNALFDSYSILITINHLLNNGLIIKN